MHSLPHIGLTFNKTTCSLQMHVDPDEWESVKDRERIQLWMLPILNWAIGAPMTDKTLYLLQKQVCYRLMEMRDNEMLTKSFIGRGWRVRPTTTEATVAAPPASQGYKAPSHST